MCVFQKLSRFTDSSISKFLHFEPRKVAMISGMLACKIGMSQIFQDNGTMVPVIQVGPMTVTQKKTKTVMT